MSRSPTCRVGVDHRGHVIDQLDDQFGHEVAGRGLSADQHATGGPAVNIPALDPVVKMNDMQYVQQLAFVLVNAFDLHIEK